MAKFRKWVTASHWKQLLIESSSFITNLNHKYDCLAEQIEDELEVDNNLLLDCTEKFKVFKENILRTNNINLQRAGYFEKSQIQELLLDEDTKYLRIYNGIFENEHFIFIAAIDSDFKVSSEANLLCTKIPPCPKPTSGNPTTIPNEEITDTFFNK